MPTVTKEFLLYTSMLDGAYDAGFLVDGSDNKGTIIYTNVAAQELFDVTGNTDDDDDDDEEDVARSVTLAGSIDEFIQFWSLHEHHHSEDDNHTHDESTKKKKKKKIPNHQKSKKDASSLSWETIVDYASRPDPPNTEWTVTGMLPYHQNVNVNGSATASITTQRSFPAVLKLTKLQAVADDGTTYWLIVLRHLDHHEMASAIAEHDMSSHAGGGSREESGAGARMKLRRQKRHAGCCVHGQKLATQNTNDVGPVIRLNDQGLVLGFHGGAASGGSWCRPEWVGQHISRVEWNTTTDSENANGKTHSPIIEVAVEQVSKLHEDKGVIKFSLDASCLQENTNSDNDSNSNAPALHSLGDPHHHCATTSTSAGIQRDENITEAVFEAALNPLFQIDEHGTIQMVNNTASKTFGWTRAEFLGSNISMICGGDHGAKHASYVARYLATGETRVIGKNRELTAKRKDGSEFPIELGVVEVDTFAGDTRLFFGFVRDLSGIKEREWLTEEMVEAALDPMVQINQSGKILMVNQATLTCFGYEREELLGRNVSLLCGGSHGKHHESYLKRFLKTGQTHIIGKYRELPAKRKDGSEFLIRLAVVELKSGHHGKERMFCGFMHDLSSRTRNEDIIRGTIDTSLDPVLHINEKGIIQRVNKATLDHLGWTQAELIGNNVSMIVGGGHAKNHDQYTERYLKTGEAKAMGRRRKLMARRQDGSEMPIELKLSEINVLGGKERLFCAFLTDLSQEVSEDGTEQEPALPS